MSCLENEIIPGRKRISLHTHFGLLSVESDDEESKHPLNVSFEISNFAESDLRVHFLKVFADHKYQAVNIGFVFNHKWNI